MKKKISGALISRISKIVITIILVLILINTALSIYNFKRIVDKKEPIFLTSIKEEENKKVYHQGLFNIIQETGIETNTQNQEITIVLRPFFLGK